MAEVKHFLDKDSIQSDADFLKGILDGILSQLKTINNTKVQLQGSKSLGAATDQVKQLKSESEELVNLKLKLAAAEDKLAAARLKNKQADGEEIKNKKLQIELDTKLTREKEKLQKAQDKELKAMEKLNNAYVQLNEKQKAASALSLKRGAELIKQANGNEALLKTLLRTDRAYIESTKNARAYNDQLLALEQNIGRSQRNVGNYSSAISGLGNVISKVGAIAAGAFTAQAALGFINDAIEEFKQAEIASARFEAKLRNIGSLEVFGRLTEEAKNLAEQFKFLDNDDIVEVFSQLVDFGKLTEKQIKALTPVIIDFAANQRISLSDATSVIIKALSGNGKALKEYGINIKDAKTESEAFGLIMTQLKPKVEGAAAVFQETLGGSVAVTEQKIKDLKEEIGTGLQPVVLKFYEFMAGALDGISSFFSDISGNLKKLVLEIGAAGLSILPGFKGASSAIRGSIRGGAPNTGADKTAVDAEVKNFLDADKEKQQRILKAIGTQYKENIAAYNKAVQQNDKEAINLYARLVNTDAAVLRIITAKKEGKDKVIGLGGGLSTVSEEDKKKADAARKKALEDAKKNLEDEIKARREIQQILLQDSIKANELIVNNTEKSYEERITAANAFYDLSKTLIEKQLEFEIADIDKKAKEAGLSEEQVSQQKLLARTKSYSKLIELERTSESQILAISKFFQDKRAQETQAAFDQRLEMIKNGSQYEQAQIAKARDEELLALEQRNNAEELSLNPVKRKAQIEKREADRLAIIRKYIKLELEDQLFRVEQLAKLETDPLKRAQLEADAAAIRLKIENQLTDTKLKNRQKEIDKEKELADLQKQLQQEVFTLIKTFTLGRFDVAKNQIQDQIDKTEEQKRKEIDAINATTLPAVEKQARITNAEKKAQGERERLELRQRQLDIQRAKFEKAFQIASIIQSTANAVMAALGKKPYTEDNKRQALFNAAIGAAQLATALAAPIPKFRTGKGQYDKYEGPAWVGDGGKSEMIFRESGEVEKTPSTPVLTWVGKNDVIHPDADALLNHTIKKQGEVMNYTVPGNYAFGEMTSTMEKGFKQLGKIVQNKTMLKVNINNGKTSIMEDQGTRQKRWLNDNMQFGG